MSADDRRLTLAQRLQILADLYERLGPDVPPEVRAMAIAAVQEAADALCLERVAGLSNDELS